MPTQEIALTLRGQGRPLLLLHAYPLSHSLWSDLVAPPGRQLILPDFPGFGDSPLAPGGYGLAQASQDLFYQLEKRGIQGPVALGGISMGGYWALEFLRQYPASVERLMLISTRAGADKPEGRQKRLDAADRAEKEGVAWLPEAMIPGLLGQTSRTQQPALVQALGRTLLAVDPKAVALAQRAMTDRRDQTDLLSGISCQTTIIAGREDALIPFSEAEAMSKAIPGAELHILEQVGHLIPWEEPKKFQKLFDDFF